MVCRAAVLLFRSGLPASGLGALQGPWLLIASCWTCVTHVWAIPGDAPQGGGNILCDFWCVIFSPKGGLSAGFGKSPHVSPPPGLAGASGDLGPRKKTARKTNPMALWLRQTTSATPAVVLMLDCMLPEHPHQAGFAHSVFMSSNQHVDTSLMSTMTFKGLSLLTP